MIMVKKENSKDSKTQNQEDSHKEIFFRAFEFDLSKEKNTKNYFKSGEKWPTDKDERKNYGELEFRNDIKKEVSKIINRRFDNIVLLAGAGASVVPKADGGINPKYGKTMQKIANNIFEELKDTNNKDTENANDNYFSLEELAKISHFKDPLKKEKDGQLSNNFSLEDFLSNVIHFEPYVDEENREKYSNTKNKILTLIKKDTEYPYDKNFLKHEAILNLLNEKVEAPNKLSVVTTNYDTIFEDAATNSNYTVFDGFKFMAEPEFDSDMFNWNLVKEVPDIKTQELEYNSRVLNLIKIHGSSTWERTANNKIIRSKNKNIEAKNSVMIFPSSDKYAQSYQEPYFELFSKFQELLKRKNTLLITAGFSFSDNHIFEMVSQAVKNNRSLTLLVSDYDIEQQNNSNWQSLLGLMTAYHQVAFLKASVNKDLAFFLGGNNDN